MTIKLPEDVQKKFEGKSPDDILAVLRTYDPATAAAKQGEALDTLAAEFTKLSAEFSDFKTEVNTLLTTFDEALSKQADILSTTVAKAVAASMEEATKLVTAAIAKTGVPAPLATSQSQTQTASTPGGVATFKSLVKTKRDSGLSLARAVQEAIKEAPDAYREWREKGDGRLD